MTTQTASTDYEIAAQYYAEALQQNMKLEEQIALCRHGCEGLRDELKATKERMIELGDVKEVYRVLLVAGMREVVRLSNAPDKPAAAIAYYAKLFELAQQSGELDKCNPDAVEAVAKLAGVPIEYMEVQP